MKEFYIWLLAFICYMIGLLSVIALFTYKGNELFSFALLILSLFMSIPAYNWWTEYFERIFKDK